jgi:hypothetical protein
MSPYHLPCANLWRRSEKFVVERRAKNNGMSAFAAVERKDDRFSSGIELSDELGNKATGNERVVDRAENNPVRGFDRQAADCRVDGRQLACGPIRIKDDHGWVELQFRTYFCSVRTEYDTRKTNAWQARGCEKMLDEGKALNRDQSFRLAHPG